MHPDEIIETYKEPLEEVRIWNGNEYELKDNNLNGQNEANSLCSECYGELVDKI